MADLAACDDALCCRRAPIHTVTRSATDTIATPAKIIRDLLAILRFLGGRIEHSRT